jgi:hypothetical protein
MGCNFTRKIHSDQAELAVRFAEDLLKFQDIPSSDFDMCFSRYSTDGYLTELQFKASIEALNLNVNINEPPFKDYLKWFNDGEKGYALKKMVCIGILLGSGSAPDKGKLLLQNYDRDYSGEMDLLEFEAMIDDLILVSVSAAVDLAKYHDDSMTSILENYEKKLKKAQKLFSVYVKFIMCMGKDNEIIKAENFIKTFSDSKMSNLASTHGIREIMIELYNMEISDS